jgi:nucleoside 2-deoxyribosyltransferase
MSTVTHEPERAARPPRIYLAGPDVFLPDPLAMGDRKKHLCAKYGFEGVFPMDSEADLAGLLPRKAALKIGMLNEELIRSCDAVLANITPFRGPSADVGTAYEMGFGSALGRLVYAYTNVSTPFTERTIAYFPQTQRTSDGRVRDPEGLAVEDWGLADNLMLETAIAKSGGKLIMRDVPAGELYTNLVAFEECLRAIAAEKLLSMRTSSH